MLEFKRDPADADRPSIVLLSATLQPARPEVMLQLARPLTVPAGVQVHDHLYDWTSAPLPALQPGQRNHVVPSLGLPAGRALRLIGPDGPSNEIFVCDPNKVRMRPLNRIGQSTGTITEQFVTGGSTCSIRTPSPSAKSC